MTRRPAALAFALFALSAAAPVLAAPVLAAPPSPDPASGPAPAALSAEDQKLVRSAVAYVDGLQSVEGRFTQTDARGRISTGVFYLKRPGRARFQYDPPAQLLVVADGTNVLVYDRKLKSFDPYPLAQTPLALLLAKPFRLDHGVSILAVDRRRDGFALTAGDARRRGLGRLTLQFSQTPLALKGWTLVDAQGQKTEVRFAALKPRPNLDPRLFVLKDPEGRPPSPNVAY